MTGPGFPNQPPARKKRSKALKVVDTKTLGDFTGTKEEQLRQLWEQWYGCRRCGLWEMRDPGGGDQGDIVFGQGNCDAPILLIGEAPGEEEEKKGIPFVGESGRLLNNLLAQTSDDPEVKERFDQILRSSRSRANEDSFQEFMIAWRHQHFFITNVVACRPPENRTPTAIEVKICWERLWNVIYIVDPLLIVVSGNTALSAVMHKLQVQITRARGRIHDAEIPGRLGMPVTYPVFPIFHPSYLLRKADFKSRDGEWAKTLDDFQDIFKTLRFLQQHTRTANGS